MTGDDNYKPKITFLHNLEKGQLFRFVHPAPFVTEAGVNMVCNSVGRTYRYCVNLETGNYAGYMNDHEVEIINHVLLTSRKTHDNDKRIILQHIRNTDLTE